MKLFKFEYIFLIGLLSILKIANWRSLGSFGIYSIKLCDKFNYTKLLSQAYLLIASGIFLIKLWLKFTIFIFWNKKICFGHSWKRLLFRMNFLYLWQENNFGSFYRFLWGKTNFSEVKDFEINQRGNILFWSYEKVNWNSLLWIRSNDCGNSFKGLF